MTYIPPDELRARGIGCHAFGWEPDKHVIRERFRQGFYQVYCSCGWVTNAYYTKRMDAWCEALDHHPEAPNMYQAYIEHTYRPSVSSVVQPTKNGEEK